MWTLVCVGNDGELGGHAAQNFEANAEGVARRPWRVDIAQKMSQDELNEKALLYQIGVVAQSDPVAVLV